MTDPTVHRVTLMLCSLCLEGAGGECHTPACALCLNRAPDLRLIDHPMVEVIDNWIRKRCECCGNDRFHKRTGRRSVHVVCARCETSHRSPTVRRESHTPT